jgi:archaeosine synthase beta-subunit
MSNNPRLVISDGWIESHRGDKNRVDQHRPYAWLVEKERTRSGSIEDVGIIFLTNRECPYRCLMCDLWKNTTDETVLPGAIPEQIAWALDLMPGVRHVKLYNSGSFFDEKAIPLSEYEKIASLLDGFESLVVESHPRLIGEKCLNFKKMLKPELEVAIGLETIHPEVLPGLNKKMTTIDFTRAVSFLGKSGISTRAFILLRPPFLDEEEGIEWAGKSVDFAFGAGVDCCVVIPVRAGNGAMEQLQNEGHFTPPSVRSLEKVLEYGISLKAGRVFADVWDLSLFSDCQACTDMRRERLTAMNLTQEVQDPVVCTCV